MPTPSGNAPDPQSPHTFSFSTCPDPDEELSASFPPTNPHTEQLGSSSPSSWHPQPPPSYAQLIATRDIAMDDAGAETSTRSDTMSPRPLSSSVTTTQDHDRTEPDGMIISRDEPEDGQKQADTDEEMFVGGPVSSSSGRGGEEGAGRGPRGVSREVLRGTQRRGGGGPAAQWSRRRQPPDMVSPVSAEGEKVSDARDPMTAAPLWAGLGYEYSNTRVIPISPSSYLRPGSRFHGTQQSERQRYDVQVEIKHVDLRESFLCGYLRIQGLTEDHPTLTTYFEGEIIGAKYGFITQHPSWGASDKIDLSHWAKFTAFRPYAKQARKSPGGGQVLIKDVAQRESIFMRWKEHFLVPDHRVRTIHGASFEGFYYICFNQVRGEVSGIYFHSKSEKFQQLELKHVEDKGCFGAMEFR